MGSQSPGLFRKRGKKVVILRTRAAAAVHSRKALETVEGSSSMYRGPGGGHGYRPLGDSIVQTK